MEELTNQLKYFTFKHAIGGHANDGDSLIWKLSFEDEADLMQKLQKLGIPFPESENILNFYGYTFIGIEKIYLSIINNFIQIEVFGANGDLYSVSDADVAVCKRIEVNLNK
ncbi:hypothetical protein CHRY9390_00414 [Chryseobacterium aquaeductus]|uniref:Uncharacterized protein n=1 Tax=Chryseobacterium aquaeductus TaxID=2675056 RepID=A0A9N8QPQ5_9FLAO|nr:hypothetical protein [Chryseobacterium aquaeductus]CAA7329771.1 hypothetical protein CHRY9390_00414 [Chryseobacterium potabilaquae]CAD7798967.1 hypothetical protein CHRY9390_00414 [Chryseobacterium aquaeductus]